MSPTVGQIDMKFGADIHVPLTMKYNDFGDPLKLPSIGFHIFIISLKL